MGKKRKTVSLDEDIHDFLTDKESDLNASSVVNSLLREYIAHGKAPEAALTKRLNELEAELQRKREEKARIESRIDQLKRQRDDVADKLRQMDQEEHEAVMKVVSLIEDESQPHDLQSLETDSELIVNLSEKADIPPGRFLEKVEANL